MNISKIYCMQVMERFEIDMDIYLYTYIYDAYIYTYIYIHLNIMALRNRNFLESKLESFNLFPYFVYM